MTDTRIDEKKIKVGRSHYALVDSENYSGLNSIYWSLSTKGYAFIERGKGKKLFMHRMIMNTPEGMDTDHIDGNPLNNTRKNLRICTHTENCRNRKIGTNNSSNFKGVSWDKGTDKWRSRIYLNNMAIHLGFHDDKIHAAKEYNKAAIKYHGDFARLNIIPSMEKL